jgi:hypothetical protein
VSTPAHLAILVLLAASAPVAAQQLEPEQAGLLEQAREAALQYSASLPDFLCTEVVRRMDVQRRPRLGDLDTLTVEDTLTVKLSYFGHREDYTLIEIDGKPTLLKYEFVAGAVSTGEFGTRLSSVFGPGSHTDFRWKGWATLRGRRVARYSYRIARENSNYQLGYGPWVITVAYHGDVYVDEETHLVPRLTLRAEIPHGFPISGNESSVDYEFAEVGGKRYLLPSHASSWAKYGTYVAENSVEFREYRKFQAESSVTFDPTPEKK